MESLGFVVPFAFVYELWWLRARLPQMDGRERLLWLCAIPPALFAGLSAAARIDGLRGVIWGISTLTALWMAGILLATVREESG